MAKRSVEKKSEKKGPLIGRPMKIFIAACAAELYLLMLRKITVNASLEQYVASYDLLLPLLWASLGVLAAGLALWLTFRKKPGWARSIGQLLFGAGLFLAIAHGATRLSYPNAVTILCALVPLVMLLGILWTLYDRECAWSLTILSASMLAVWVCRRELHSQFVGRLVLIGACVYILLLLALALLTRRLDRTGGKLGKVRIAPDDMDYLPVCVSCGLSIASLAVSLVSTAAAYYALWVLAVVIFALAVYYTVRQL